MNPIPTVHRGSESFRSTSGRDSRNKTSRRCGPSNDVDELLEERERPVERDDLPETADPVAETVDGHVVEEYVTCGKDDCKCASGAESDMHGPYEYRYYRDGNGTLHKEYAETE